MAPSPRALSTLVVSPTSFFEEHEPVETLHIAAGLVVLLMVCTAVGMVFVGSTLAGTIDATVTIDNPDRPPETFCEGGPDMPELRVNDGCDEPETIERDVGELAQEAIGEYLWVGLLGPGLLWVLGTIVLYGGGRLAGGQPSGWGTLAVAGWAALPELVRLGVGLGGLYVAVSNVTITDAESGPAVIEAAIAPVEPLLLVASVGTVVWQWTLLTGGLAQDADTAWSSAAVAVGIPLGAFFLLTLL